MKRWISLLTLLCCVECANASHWQDLWRRPDQQALKLLEQKKYLEAAERFQDPNWQGIAQYRAGNYEEAAQRFSQDKTANGRYNYANALAQQEKYSEAIRSYNEALKLKPDLIDAEFNKKLLEDAMKKQQQAKDQQENQSQNTQHDQGQQRENKQNNNSNPTQQPRQTDSKEIQDPSKTNAEGKNQEKDREQNSMKEDEKVGENDLDKSKDKGREKDREKGREKGREKEEDGSEKMSPEKNPAQAENDKIQAKTELQQWLQKIPDDPAGLLRRKFIRDHQRRHWDQEG